MSASLARAIACAHADALAPASAPPDGRARAFFAIGDPQAPLERFLGVLDAHGLLNDAGRLRADAGLISIGDHFDWGPVAARGKASLDGTAILAWLAAHPSDQVVILAGNHDLARVGELWDFDDLRFARSQALADAAYFGDDDEARAAFRLECPALPSAEMLARDLSSFRSAQRALVERLLTAGRLRLAHARNGMLFVHAGVTVDELATLALLETPPHADTVARALNAALDAAWRTRHGALTITGLHAPGDAVREAEGMLFHRASVLEDEQHLWDRPIPRRRFSPQRLPPGLVQVIGHIQDKKTRGLLGLEGPALHGRLRTLDVVDGALRYALGVPAASAGDGARVIYIDAGMQHVERAAATSLFDVDSRVERRAP